MVTVSIIADLPTRVSLFHIVTAVARTARMAWEPMWLEWKRVNRYPGPIEPASRDVCVPTSFALRDALRRTVPEIWWKVAGGRPTKRTPRGGFMDSQGTPHPHLWVVGRCVEGPVVVDISADQFGAEPVLVEVGPLTRHTANATTRPLRYYEAHEATTVEMFLLALDHAFKRQTVA